MTSKKLDIASSVTAGFQSAHVVDKEASKAKLQEFMKEETRTVRGIFQCFETPGSSTTIVVKKYPGQTFVKNMTDGQEYEIPLYVARHLNGHDHTAGALGDASKRNTNIGTCSYPVHGYVLENKNASPNINMDVGIPVPIVGIAKRVKRYGFQSLEFAGAA